MSTHASERAFDAIDSPVSGINVKKCLSGSAIKMIAVISMIIDHMTAYILVFYGSSGVIVGEKHPQPQCLC